MSYIPAQTAYIVPPAHSVVPTAAPLNTSNLGVAAVAQPAIHNTQIQARRPDRNFSQINRDEAEAKLRAVCKELQIPSNLRDKMRALSEYDVVMIIDNSASMRSRDGEIKKNGYEKKSRWEELEETVTPIVRIMGCLDEDGITIHSFDRKANHVTNADQVKGFFNTQPSFRCTPLCQTFETVINEYRADYTEEQKPLYVMIATDGAPTGQGESEARFQELISNERNLPEGIKISIMACTNNEDEVGYLNHADNNKTFLDVSDDYRSELAEVQRKAPDLANKFTKPFWQGKIILGPIYPDFDNLDELATADNAKAVNKKFVFGGCFPFCK